MYQVRILSVHFKALCLEHPFIRDAEVCKKLASQVSILKTWIEEKTADDMPFVVMGDFNSRLSGRENDFWSKINDGERIGESLVRAKNEGFTSKC